MCTSKPSPGCKKYSPYGNVGSAAIIAEGIQVKINGLASEQSHRRVSKLGSKTQALTIGCIGSYRSMTSLGMACPLPAGHALTNGSGSITGTFPKIAGASSYKILKMDWDGGTVPGRIRRAPAIIF